MSDEPPSDVREPYVAEVVDLAAARRVREQDRRLSDIQLALLRKARRLRRRSTVRP